MTQTVTDLMNAKATGVWLGLKRCGCPVAVCNDYGEDGPKEFRKMAAQSKREYLKQGLQVVYASWAEWHERWYPIFVRDCEHDRARNARELSGSSPADHPVRARHG